MNLNPSNTQEPLAATTAFNANKNIIIKGFFTQNSTNVIVYEDERDQEITLTNVPAFLVLPIGGKISIKTGTTVALTILL